MDARFDNLGFAANPPLNAFKNLGNSNPFGVAGAGYNADTTLRLDYSDFSTHFFSASKGIKRKWSLIDGSTNLRVGSELHLGLGNSSSSSDSKGSSATSCTTMSSAKETDEESSVDLELDFTLHLGHEKAPSPGTVGSNMKAVNFQPKVNLELSLSTGSAESDVITVHHSPIVPQYVNKMLSVDGELLCIDEGSTSSRWRMKRSFQPLQTSLNTETNFFLNQALKEIKPAPISSSPDLSSSIITTPKSSVTCTSGATQQWQCSSSTKTCQFKGCVKGARGASGLCIAHGSGCRCQKPGCLRGAEGRTAYGKAHGGGRRCEFLGCTKSADGRTDFCIYHGGGRRCSHEGCTRAARGKSGLCIRHGEGKRCQKENCTKSAEGRSGLCISHGGGYRCEYSTCTKGAQGGTMFCKAHGGGKRCTFKGCTKGADKGHGGGKRCSFQGGGVCPKSVHGGILFCVAHGGGKRCAVPDCTKSARGRTQFCVRHGGGRRCKFEGSGKSAEGSADFCKAHGGGKRCSCGQPGSEFGKGDNPCNSFVRGKTGMCASHDALVQDKRVHGGAHLGAMIQDSKLGKPHLMNKFATAEDASVLKVKMEGRVVTSAGCSSGWKHFSYQQASLPVVGISPSVPVAVPDGRVHGGNLMALLAGGSGPAAKHTMPRKWM